LLFLPFFVDVFIWIMKCYLRALDVYFCWFRIIFRDLVVLFLFRLFFVCSFSLRFCFCLVFKIVSCCLLFFCVYCVLLFSSFLFYISLFRFFVLFGFLLLLLSIDVFFHLFRYILRMFALFVVVLSFRCMFYAILLFCFWIFLFFGSGVFSGFSCLLGLGLFWLAHHFVCCHISLIDMFGFLLHI